MTERAQGSHRRFPAKGLRVRGGDSRERPHNFASTRVQHLTSRRASCRRASCLDGQVALLLPGDIAGAQLTQGVTGSLYDCRVRVRQGPGQGTAGDRPTRTPHPRKARAPGQFTGSPADECRPVTQGGPELLGLEHAKTCEGAQPRSAHRRRLI